MPFGPVQAAGLPSKTQKVSGADPLQIAALKGLVAGAVNLAIASLLGASLPRVPLLLAALGVGLLGYGVSLSLFVLALRHLGTARSSAYFSSPHSWAHAWRS